MGFFKSKSKPSGPSPEQLAAEQAEKARQQDIVRQNELNEKRRRSQASQTRIAGAASFLGESNTSKPSILG